MPVAISYDSHEVNQIGELKERDGGGKQVMVLV